MARIPQSERLPMIDRHVAHWNQVNAALPAPLVLPGTFAIAQLEAQRLEFVTLNDERTLLEQTLLPASRAERDATWGLTAEDQGGLWFQLRNYRPLVKALLGARHPLARIIPNLMSNHPGNYLPMARSFIDHWTQVNAELGASPLVLGTLTLANLQTAVTGLDTLIRDISADELRLSLLREQIEQLFGDESEDVREASSIIAKLLLYHATVQARFAGQPLGDSLPDIFPPDSPATLPSFGFHWNVTPAGDVKVWYSAPAPEWNAAQVFLKEGADTLTEPVNASRTVLWPGMTIVDDLDDVELRNPAGLTVARGTRDASLPSRNRSRSENFSPLPAAGEGVNGEALGSRHVAGTGHFGFVTHGRRPSVLRGRGLGRGGASPVPWRL